MVPSSPSFPSSDPDKLSADIQCVRIFWRMNSDWCIFGIFLSKLWESWQFQEGEKTIKIVFDFVLLLLFVFLICFLWILFTFHAQWLFLFPFLEESAVNRKVLIFLCSFMPSLVYRRRKKGMWEEFGSPLNPLQKVMKCAFFSLLFLSKDNDFDLRIFKLFSDFLFLYFSFFVSGSLLFCVLIVLFFLCCPHVVCDFVVLFFFFFSRKVWL